MANIRKFIADHCNKNIMIPNIIHEPKISVKMKIIMDNICVSKIVRIKIINKSFVSGKFKRRF